jgi:non-ribosomal peptide synthetase component E (peptide arylation enzyme)
MHRPPLSSTVQYIVWHARHESDTTAIVEADRRISYRALAADIARCAQALDQAAIWSGVRFGIETPNRTHQRRRQSDEVPLT